MLEWWNHWFYISQKKAEYIKKTTKMLQDKFKCDIPNSVEGLVCIGLTLACV